MNDGVVDGALEGVPLFESVQEAVVDGVGADESVAAAEIVAVPVPVPVPVLDAVPDTVDEKDVETVTAAVPEADAPDDSVGVTTAVPVAVAVFVPVPVPVNDVEAEGEVLGEREPDGDVLKDGVIEPLHINVVAKHWMRRSVI